MNTSKNVSVTHDEDLNAYIAKLEKDVSIENYKTVVTEIDAIPIERVRFLILDFSVLDRLASIGIGLVYHTLDVVSSRKRILLLVATQRMARYALDLCGASNAVKVFSDIADARAHIRICLDKQD